jgi:hypothetical protein
VLDEHVREPAADAGAGDDVGDGRRDVAAAASECVEGERGLVRHRISWLSHRCYTNGGCNKQKTV